MESVNRLLGGINTDVNPGSQPKDTVRNMVNFVPVTKDGNIYSVINENGTKLFEDISFPEGFSVIGQSILNTDIIVILADDEGNSQIGIIKDDSNHDETYGKYHPVAPIDTEGNVPVNNKEFGFSKQHPVDCVSRKLINGQRVLYYTDFNQPFGSVNLDNPPVEGEVKEKSKLIFDQSLPKFKLVTIKDGVSGTFKPGVYQLVTRYVTENGDVTSFGIPSGIIPITKTFKSEGVNNYQGGANDGETVNKNVVVEISNIDTKFNELEIAAIYYEGESNVFRAVILGTAPITSDTITYNFTGIDSESAVNVTKEEIRQAPITYTKAKCIEQHDNVLFLSNLAGGVPDYDKELQEIANHITVKYKVNEVQYSGYGHKNYVDDPATEFYVKGAYKTGDPNNLEIYFTKDVDPATTVNDIVLHKPGTTASSKITVTAGIVTGNSLTTPALGDQIAVTLTATDDPNSVTDNVFLIGADVEETLNNLFSCINTSPDMIYYGAYFDGADLYLYWKEYGTAINGYGFTTNSGNFTAVAFSGGTDTTVTSNANAISVAANVITLTFDDVVTLSDTVQIVNVDSTEGDSYTTYSPETFTISIQDELDSTTEDQIEDGFTDYINEELTFEGKTYKRGEVYSLGFVLVYKSGGTSPVYHIPGGFNGNINPTDIANGIRKFGDPDWGSYSNQNFSNGKLGVYISDEQYPLNQNYPGNEEGDNSATKGIPGYERNVRHHLIPYIENEPHYRNDEGTVWIRPISLEFEFDSQFKIPQYIADDVAEIMFVRERRNTNQNKSCFSQGVLNTAIVMHDQNKRNGQVDGVTLPGGTLVEHPLSGYYVSKAPCFDNVKIAGFDGVYDGFGTEEGVGSGGMVYPNLQDYFVRGTEDYDEGTAFNSQAFCNRGFFSSPETKFSTGYGILASDVIGGFLKPVLRMSGFYNIVRSEGQNLYWEPYEFEFRSTVLLDAFCDYDYRFESNYYILNNTPNILNARITNAGEYRLPSIDSTEVVKTSTRWTTSSLEIVCDDDFQDYSMEGQDVNNREGEEVWTIPLLYVDLTTDGETRIIDRVRRLNISVYETGDIIPNVDGESLVTGLFGSNDRGLFELNIKNLNQYGTVLNSSYINIGRFNLVNDQGIINSNFTGVYGGDIFITKFYYNDGQVIPFGSFYQSSRWSSWNNGKNQVPSRDYYHIDGRTMFNGDAVGSAQGHDMRWTTGYFVESEINCYYRHKDDEESQSFYPNTNNPRTNLDSFIPYLDEVKTYNSQYSFEDTVKEYYTKGSTDQIINKFENRTIYSEQAAEDNILDSYRSFLQNNYYDLPSNTGCIWDSFVFNNQLYLHTPKSLWRTFAESSATLKGGNISDVVLGTGSLFSRPSIEMLTTQGGYGGTISQFGGIHTPVGYIFPDVLQGKIFMLAIGEKSVHLKELSMSGVGSFMHKNLGTGIDLSFATADGCDSIDNPYIGIGLTGGYDYKLKRAFITKHGGFTISYSVLTDNWFSFHSCQPDLILSYNNRLFFFQNKEGVTMWEMNEGDPCSYFGNIFDSEIEIVTASPEHGEKTFQNFKIYSDSYLDNLRIRDDNFYQVRCFTDRSNSGVYSIINDNAFDTELPEGQLPIKFRNTEYRMTIPRDSVIDNGANIFDENNLYNTVGGNYPIDEEYYFRERLKGYYLTSQFKYSNNFGRTFILHGINTIFNKNIR